MASRALRVVSRAARTARQAHREYHVEHGVVGGAILESLDALMESDEDDHRTLNEVPFVKPGVGYDTSWAFRCFRSMCVAEGSCSRCRS